MFSLERCKDCNGSGRLGSVGEIRLVCETCNGYGKVLINRASIMDEYWRVTSERN